MTLAIEQALCDWVTSIPGLTDTAAQPGITADELPAAAPVFVVELAQLENVLGPLYKASVTISLRSPALVTARATHAVLWETLVAALADKLWLERQFNRGAAASNLVFAGLADPHGPISHDVRDEFWRSDITLILGLRRI